MRSEANAAPPVSLSASLRELPSWRRKLAFLLGRHTPHWCRVVMDRQTEHFVDSLEPARLDVLEVSGQAWHERGFRSYRSVWFPDYDICAEPLEREAFDLVIAEQVLEHVLRPRKALEHAWQMLRPGGWVMITTPFLIRIHAQPHDCSRWTEQGMRQMMVEAGFPEAAIRTGSWGNRSCVKGNLENWVRFKPLLHSLANDPRYPVVVWAFARKAER